MIACKGTERAIPPPHGLLAEEAPYCRAIIEKRENHEVLIEETWGDWTHLSNRKLTRPLRASHVNITVFAANPSEGSTEPISMPAEPPVPAHESPDETPVPLAPNATGPAGPMDAVTPIESSESHPNSHRNHGYAI